MKSQSEAVFTIVTNFVAEKNLRTDESTPVKDILTKDHKHAIIGIIVAGFKAGEIDLSERAKAKFDTDQKLRNYSSGLLNNWLRKNTKLNGGVTYVPKNPGSRAGAGDQQLKALKALRANTEDADTLKMLDDAIETRKKELVATKKTVTITPEMLAALPEHIREAFLANSTEVSEVEEEETV